MRLTAAEINELRDLVMARWDPIGVPMPENGPEDRASYWTEYDDYLPAIVGHLDAGDDVASLAAHLADFHTRNKGLRPRPDLDRAAATAIVEWHRRTRPR